MLTYKIADLYINIESKYDFTKEYLKNYVVEEHEPNFTIIVTDEMIDYERSVNNEQNTEPYFEPLAILRTICDKVIRYNGFFFHCSCLEYNGGAYIFTGKSGTGKSTHAALWRKHFGDKVTMINDDKPIVRMKDNQFYVYGTPYNGKHNIGNNICAPIKGIYQLEQSPTNEIQKLNTIEYTMSILHQTIIPNDKSNMNKLLELFNLFVSSIPAYKLKCNISDEAVITALSVIK